MDGHVDDSIAHSGIITRENSKILVVRILDGVGAVILAGDSPNGGSILVVGAGEGRAPSGTTLDIGKILTAVETEDIIATVDDGVAGIVISNLQRSIGNGNLRVRHRLHRGSCRIELRRGSRRSGCADGDRLDVAQGAGSGLALLLGQLAQGVGDAAQQVAVRRIGVALDQVQDRLQSLLRLSGVLGLRLAGLGGLGGIGRLFGWGGFGILIAGNVKPVIPDVTDDIPDDGNDPADDAVGAVAGAGPAGCGRNGRCQHADDQHCCQNAHPYGSSHCSLPPVFY